MKNHIAVKFVAVFLCALTLLGAVGGAAGIFVMTELDLYARTVDQLKAERMVSGAEAFAHSAAVRYASETLGGCPEEFLNNYYGDFVDTYYTEGQYAYRILDGEGKEVYSYGEIRDAEATSYTFPVTGRYLHLVSHETPEQRENRLMATAASYSANFTIGDDARIMDALPPDGRHAAYISLCDADGNVVYELYDENGVGFLYYDKAGRVTFSGTQYAEDPDLMGMTVAGAYFQSMDGTVLYEATASAGVGVISFSNDGRLVFTAGIDESVTVLPAEEASAEETEQVEAVPAGIFPIFYVAFLNEADEQIYEVFSEQSVGLLTRNEDGRALYRGYRPETEKLPEEVRITDAYFYSYNEGLIYHASSQEGAGTVSYTPDGQLIFLSVDPEPVFDLEALVKKPEEKEQTEQTEESEDAEETEETEETEATEVTEATEAEEDKQDKEPSSASGIPDETVVPETAAVQTGEDTGLINGKPLEEYQIDTSEYYSFDQQDHIFVSYVRPTLPEYTVELHLTADALGMAGEYRLLELLKNFSGYLFPMVGICLILFAVCAVYLCCAAGRKPGSDEVKASGLNAIPLDLYTIVDICLVVAACAVGAELGIDRLNQNLVFSSILVAAVAFVICLLVVAFCFAVVAQVKTPGGYWWRNTLTMRFMMLFFRFAAWFEKFLGRKCFPWLGRLVKWLWKVGVLGLFRLWEKFAAWFLVSSRRFFRWLYARLSRFFSLIPLTWQWMLGGCVLIFIAAVFANGSVSDSVTVLSLAICFAIVFYVSHCFGILSDSTKRMGKGDLDVKVDDKLLIGCFKDFADDLNDLADVAVVAAQKQLKSERMKTELITNVSHDIKTPLTSIINYVDLLQKPHSEEEQEQYLEVLDRQSLRLKKLIDDLMEMSKASTGNMAVEITTVDAVESVNQALGEFSDKLAAARLTPMFRHAENRVSMRADGKLVWRVLSNILSNAVKYAMPGTRLYIDLMELEGKVVISLKNISREELNVDADELMERFVRGDDSRNTEGSGLGLNIAKSLMELQKGQLQLLVDGDLFKVTLIFPGIS